MYYLNSRFYDPEICRFISADTIDLVLVSQNMLANKNLYSYCNNNPVNHVDIDGYIAFTTLLVKASIDALISMFTALVITASTGQKVKTMEILGVGLATGFVSFFEVGDILVAASSGFKTFLEVYDQYSLGTALLAGGIDAFVSYAGFNSTVLRAIPDSNIITKGAMDIVFGTTDGIVTEGANLLIEAWATPTPQPLVIKELIRKDESVGKPTYVKGGNSCAIK